MKAVERISGPVELELVPSPPNVAPVGTCDDRKDSMLEGGPGTM